MDSDASGEAPVSSGASDWSGALAGPAASVHVTGVVPKNEVDDALAEAEAGAEAGAEVASEAEADVAVSEESGSDTPDSFGNGDLESGATMRFSSHALKREMREIEERAAAAREDADDADTGTDADPVVGSGVDAGSGAAVDGDDDLDPDLADVAVAPESSRDSELGSLALDGDSSEDIASVDAGSDADADAVADEDVEPQDSAPADPADEVQDSVPPSWTPPPAPQAGLPPLPPAFQPAAPTSAPQWPVPTQSSAPEPAPAPA
ncbi:MAG: hypothetical protein WCD21_07405, partial [Streptomyces sp.]